MAKTLPLYGITDPSNDGDYPVVKSTGLRVLKSASSNGKLGKGKRVFTKGPWQGMPLYALTLPERLTCPTYCIQWDVCYGDNMPWAKRYRSGPALHRAIRQDVETLDDKHGTEGFVVRLHVLGDFHSVPYSRVWLNLLMGYPNLRIFGYTHRNARGCEIAAELVRVTRAFPERFRILSSDRPMQGTKILPVASTLPAGSSDPVVGSVICPEQTGATESCLTCGLCCNGKTSITFLLH